MSSTDIQLRDQTTKAMVNLLEQQSDVLIDILKKFNNIDDLYILERLYAIAYGCILRTEKIDSINKIARAVYDLVFKKGNPPKHILLRDYARNTIEYGFYRSPKLKLNKHLITPPYNSEMPDKLPTKEDVKKYNLDLLNLKGKVRYARMNNLIYHSVMEWDFGRYVVENAFRDFMCYSFTFEKKYKSYYKSLNTEQKKILRELRLNVKMLSTLPKLKNGYIKRAGQENYDKYVSVLKDCNELLLEFVSTKFTEKDCQFIINSVLPHFESIYMEDKFYRNSLNIKPIKSWIVERVFHLGYDTKRHGAYDDSVDRLNIRMENKIERIGKKYQWIALFEMLAMVSDNFLHLDESRYGREKYNFYKGPWQMSIRDINPSYTLKKIEDKDDGNDKSDIVKKAKDWWNDIEYNYWENIGSNWVEEIKDLPNVKDVILKVDRNDTKGVFLNKFSSWEEPKPFGEEKYYTKGKQIRYLIQSYLVKRTDKSKITKYLSDKNFWGRWMPESADYNKLINREKFWSPAYKHNYYEKKWQVIQDTNYKVILTTTKATGEMSEDKSGAHVDYDMPCKTLFEGMHLHYAPVDGEFKNTSNDLTVVNKEGGVLIKKDELDMFLTENNLEIFWIVLGEKISPSNEGSNYYFKVPCGVFYFDNNDFVGKLNLHDTN